MSTRAGAAAPRPAVPRREPARERPQEVRRPAEARPRRAPARRSGLRAGLLVIPLIALLLGGIVWVNVSKLAFTAEAGRVVERARAVEAENVRLKAQLDRAHATVVDRAQDRLGMGVPAESSITPLPVP